MSYKSTETEDLKYDNTTLDDKDDYEDESYISKIIKKGASLMNTFSNMGIEDIIVTSGLLLLNDIFVDQNNQEFQKEWEDFLMEDIEAIIKSKESEFKFQSFEKEEKNIIEAMKENISSTLDEEIEDSIKNYIIDFISENAVKENINKINKLNILVLGDSQIGKTTLIVNALKLKNISGEIIGGKGISTTMNDTIYSSEELKHLQIIDTRGIQKTDFNFDDWLKNYTYKMQNNTKFGNFNELIHGIWYCVTGNVINDNEIDKIKKLNELFHGYKVPIIFVYLKPFVPQDIKIIKQRLKQFDLIESKNWIVVQSINFTLETEDDEFNFGKYKQEYHQKNVDNLLYLTKNLTSKGIFNSVASRANEKIKEEIEYFYNKSLNENYHRLESNMTDIEDQLRNLKSPKIINQNIKKLNENLIKNMIKLLEEILYGSKRNLKEETQQNLSSIHQIIENLYKKQYYKVFENTTLYMINRISKKKQLLREIKNRNTWFGCDKNVGNINEYDLLQLLLVFSSKCYVEIYAMKKSYEIITQNLKMQLIEIIRKGIDNIIKNKYLKEKLEKSILKFSKEHADILMENFAKEIKNLFPKK